MNVGLSVSRVGRSCSDQGHEKASGSIRIDLAQYREMEVLLSSVQIWMRLQRSSWLYGKRLMELLKQPLGRPLSLHEQVITLCAVTHKVMLTAEVRQIKEFQMEMLEWFDRKHPELGNEIEETKVLSDELADRIVAAANEFKEAVWQTQERSRAV